eukprot:2997601-Prorocentrum_lima.AAC.1
MGAVPRRARKSWDPNIPANHQRCALGAICMPSSPHGAGGNCHTPATRRASSSEARRHTGASLGQSCAT